MANKKLPRRAVGAWLTEAEARQINETLGGMTAENPVARAIDLLLTAHESGEVATALNPQLTPDARQFWAGNAYAISQIRDLLALACEGKLNAPRR